jgi:hypothetical protein
MAVIPTDKISRIAFCESHNPLWAENAVAMGTTTTAVTALVTMTTAARAAATAQQAAQEAARAATNDLNMAVAAMAAAAQDIINQVRVKASTAGNGVYSLAGIPVPATPSPVGAPGTPFALKVDLKPNGSVELSWKANNPPRCTGVIWQVYRKVESTGAYEYLGGAGSRVFVDTTVPAGVPSVMYQIQGTRSTAIGDAAEFVVNFGVVGTPPTISVTSNPKPVKIAA